MWWGVFVILMRLWYKILFCSLIGEWYVMLNFRVCLCYSCDDGVMVRCIFLDYIFYVWSVVLFFVLMKIYYIVIIIYIVINVVLYCSMILYYIILVNYLKIMDVLVGF